MLELKQIRKSYKVGDTSQEVLKGIDISFRKNEFTCILGSSGSGKTTLLNIIGGLDRYDSGDLIIEGVSTRNYKDSDWDAFRNYRVGFIFQSYNLIMHQSVYTNVEMALTLSGVSKSQRKKKVLEALEKVGLKDHVHKKPSQLSGGQMQRVAIARALVNDPEIILADEPTGALDSQTSIQIMDLLKSVAGDKLIVMVTHNPELAKEYATRIITLKDGVIIDDTDPYQEVQEIKSETRPKRTSMSYLTCLSLSFKNLLTKKRRTLLTAIAGSIGIIGIALILSLSNGVNSLVTDLEKDSMGDYPITIEKESFDLFGSIASSISDIGAEKAPREAGKLYSKDDLMDGSSEDSMGLMTKNDVRSFKQFVESSEEIKEAADAINFSYDLELQVYNAEGNLVSTAGMKQNAGSLFSELDSRAQAMENKYTLLAGSMPAKEDEIVLIVGADNTVEDSMLYAMGVKSLSELKDNMAAHSKDENYKVPETSYSYEDFIGLKFRLILNTDYYKEYEGAYIDCSNDRDYMQQKIAAGRELTLVGVIEDAAAAACSLGYTPELTGYLIEEISKTEIYSRQMADPSVNVLTGEEFDGVFSTFATMQKLLGIYDKEDPSSISIYPKDYKSKEVIEEAIQKYNEEKEAAGEKEKVVKYTDMMKSVFGNITSMVDIVSYILIAFVAISLIVSSIMISIITYISVLERTKEIGILRAIGATKKDIRRVFRAETIIEGLIAGLLGVGVTFLLTIPINMIVAAFTQVDGVAKLPVPGAVILVALSVLLNVFAGRRPSKIAAQKDPVESLRTE